jgi:hypothetical protein
MSDRMRLDDCEDLIEFVASRTVNQLPFSIEVTPRMDYQTELDEPRVAFHLDEMFSALEAASAVLGLTITIRVDDETVDWNFDTTDEMREVNEQIWLADHETQREHEAELNEYNNK